MAKLVIVLVKRTASLDIKIHVGLACKQCKQKCCDDLNFYFLSRIVDVVVVVVVVATLDI